jgi:hypothetical protein
MSDVHNHMVYGGSNRVGLDLFFSLVRSSRGAGDKRRISDGLEDEKN